MNELAVSVGDAYQDQPVSTTYVGPGHGAYAAFQPGSAVAMGFDDLKVIEAHDFLRSIADGTARGITLRDAVRSAATLDAMARSVETGTWVEVPRA
jgi:predicted dehydrogenase